MCDWLNQWVASLNIVIGHNLGLPILLDRQDGLDRWYSYNIIRYLQEVIYVCSSTTEYICQNVHVIY